MFKFINYVLILTTIFMLSTRINPKLNEYFIRYFPFVVEISIVLIIFVLFYNLIRNLFFKLYKDTNN